MGAAEVAVVARAGDPIPLHDRLAWLRESLPAATVTPVWERTDGCVEWRTDDAVTRVLDEGAETVRAVDAGASAPVEVVAVDGPLPSDVRRDPMRFWEAISEAARPRFVRRVRLFGPESTGKSTAAEALAARFSTVWAPEMSRPLYIAAGYRFTFDDVARVAAAQVEAEETAARAATRVLLCDTDVLTTHLYARHYVGRSPAIVAALADARRYAATLLFNLDVPWEADPVRDSPAARAHLYGVFAAELRIRAIAHTVVRGTGAARLDAAARAVAAVLEAPEPVRAQ